MNLCRDVIVGAAGACKIDGLHDASLIDIQVTLDSTGGHHLWLRLDKSPPKSEATSSHAWTSYC